MKRRLAALLTAVLLAPSLATAETPSSPAQPAQPVQLAHAGDPVAERRARAEELFKQGLTLQGAGDYEGAIDAYRRSLAEMPSSASTMNAAFCLRAVGRTDEALEMYEELLARFSSRVHVEERAAIEKTMNDLGKGIGALALTANVDALIFVDGKPRGRLPREAPIHLRTGRHLLRIRRDGYLTFERMVDVPAAMVLVLDAHLDPVPPPPPVVETRVPEPESFGDHLFMEASLGYAGGALHADAEQGCTASCSANGVLATLRGGYRFGFGLSFDLTFGYLFAGERLTRSKTWTGVTPAVTYELHDDLRLQGSVFGLGVGYRRPVGSTFGVMGRVTVGVLAARSSDAIDGTAVTSAGSIEVVTTDRGQVKTSQPGFVMPEIGVDLVSGRVRVAASLGALVMAVQGPRFTHSQIGLRTPACVDGGLGCLPNTGAVAGEIAYRSLVLWVPQLSAGYAF